MKVLQKHNVPMPEGYSAYKKGGTSGADAFVTDRDEKGEPKAPEKAEVPRIAAKKKKEAQPEEIAPPAPMAAPPAPVPAPPAPAPMGGGGDVLGLLPTELILKIVEELPKMEGFEQNKDLQEALISVTEILKGRPVEPAKPAEGAAPMPMAASQKKAGEPFGGKQSPPFGKKDEEKKDKEASIDDLKLAEVEKVAVAPPGGENVVKGLKEDSDVDNPWAVAWSMYNKGDKMSALQSAVKVVAAEFGKVGNASYGAFSWNQDTGKVEEGSLPEAAEAHSKVDDNTGIKRPETVLPSKLAGEMTLSKAVKEAEGYGKQLKGLYLEAKALTSVNDTRPVRAAVEAIYAAGNMFDEACKVLNKQSMQEDQEAEAAKVKGKKSSLLGLSVAAAE